MLKAVKYHTHFQFSIFTDDNKKKLILKRSSTDVRAYMNSTILFLVVSAERILR